MAAGSGTVKCPRCRQPLPEGSRFCLVCGAPVGSPGTATGGGAETKRARRSRSTKSAARAPRRKPAEAKASGVGGSPKDAVQPRTATGSNRSHITMGLLAMLIGGVALAAYGLVSTTGGGEEATPGVRPLARAGIGVDTREPLPDPGSATTDTIAPGEEPEPESGGSGGGEGGGRPPTTGIASPAQALAAAFDLAEGEAAVPCSAAQFDDALCYQTYLTNLEQGRYLYEVGLPFSEFSAWALVEQQGDGTFATTQTADFDFEGDGTPPFSPGGAMAGITFTSQLLDDHPIDSLDDGNSPVPAGSTEVFLFIRYTGIEAPDEATLTLDADGSPIGEPATIDVDASGEGSSTVRIYEDDGTQMPAGTYTATVLLNGVVIARASVDVMAA